MRKLASSFDEVGLNNFALVSRGYVGPEECPNLVEGEQFCLDSPNYQSDEDTYNVAKATDFTEERRQASYDSLLDFDLLAQLE